MTTNSSSVYIGADAGKQTLSGSNTIVGANAFQSSKMQTLMKIQQ